MPDAGRGDKPLEGMRTAGYLLAIPTLLIVSPLAGFFMGGQLDRWFGTAPWLTMIFLVLGFVAGGRQVHLIYLRYLADEERRKRR
jgi:ATP synthase protein I